MKKRILVSAGHSNILGLDKGAEGCGFVEGVEAVKVRDAVAARLREMKDDLGVEFEVLEDGFDGDNQPLTKAVALARAADVAIEFHFNASDNPKATGIEVLAKPTHKKLAQIIAAGIRAATNLPLRGDAGYKSDGSGQHHRLVFCEAGGVIVEVCFISNPSDMTAYKTYFEAMCRNIADFLASEIV